MKISDYIQTLEIHHHTGILGIIYISAWIYLPTSYETRIKPSLYSSMSYWDENNSLRVVWRKQLTEIKETL